MTANEKRPGQGASSEVLRDDAVNPEDTSTTSLVQVASYDYGALEPAVAADLRAQAERIRGRIRKTTTDIILIGHDLAAAKKHIVGHGDFVRWVEAEVGIEARSAQRYMAAAQLYDKNDTVSLLPPATVYRLAAKSAPVPVIEAVVAKAAAGEIVPDTAVKEMIADAKYEQQQNEARARREEKHRKLPKRKREQIEREQREREEDDRRHAERVARAAATLIEALATKGASLVYATFTTPGLGWRLLDALAEALQAASVEPQSGTAVEPTTPAAAATELADDFSDTLAARMRQGESTGAPDDPFHIPPALVRTRGAA